MDKFSKKVAGELNFYVYCLVDPTDNKIFYIGKGKDDRVFDHARNAINNTDPSLKLDKISSIIDAGKEVKYYILRHKLDRNSALILESTLIDLLTFKDFNTESLLVNIQGGYHQWNEGIKTTDEIEQLYDCKEISLDDCEEKLFIVKLNQTVYSRKKGKAIEPIYLRPSMYESTRKWWKASYNRMRKADYLLGVYQGVVRSVYMPKKEKGKTLDLLNSNIIQGATRYAFICENPEDKSEYKKIVDKYLNKRLVYTVGGKREEFMNCRKEFRYWNI